MDSRDPSTRAVLGCPSKCFSRETDWGGAVGTTFIGDDPVTGGATMLAPGRFVSPELRCRTITPLYLHGWNKGDLSLAPRGLAFFTYYHPSFIPFLCVYLICQENPSAPFYWTHFPAPASGPLLAHTPLSRFPTHQCLGWAEVMLNFPFSVCFECKNLNATCMSCGTHSVSSVTLLTGLLL